MLLIIDCLALCYRAKYAMKNIELSHNEMKTEIMFNFLNQILELAKRFETDAFAFAWDSRKSKRRKLYPKYKYKRREEKTLAEQQFDNMSREQFHILRNDVLPSLGFKNSFIQTGMEADDIIASIVTDDYTMETIGNVSQDVLRKDIVMVSRDHDLFQLLDFADMYDFQTKKMKDTNWFTKKYSVYVHNWRQVKSIAGCTTDNVPGVPGVKEKTAIKYIRNILPKHYKTYKAITSKEGKKTIERNAQLVCLPFKGTKKFTFKKEKLHSKDFYGTFERFGFHSFMEQNNFYDWKVLFNLF